jgi:hypothetical protein
LYYGEAGPLGTEYYPLLDADLDGVCDALEHMNTVCPGTNEFGTHLPDGLPDWTNPCRDSVERYPGTEWTMDSGICFYDIREDQQHLLARCDWANPGKNHRTENRWND